MTSDVSRLPRTADVVIIGAGVTGSSIAAHLKRLEPSTRTLLLDQEHVGAGSSSRSTAAFRHQWSILPHVAFSRYASEEYDRLTDRGHPIQFRRNGYLFLFTDSELLSHAAVRVEKQRKMGVHGVRVLRPDEIPGVVPGGAHLKLDGLAGATWGPDDGFLDPLAVAQAYLDEARDASVQYVPDASVAEVERDASGNRVGGVLLADGSRVAAPCVVNAAGVWSRSIAASAKLDLPIKPAKRYLYHTHPLREAGVSDWPMLIAPSGAHLRPSEGNTLMMAWEHRPPTLETPAPAQMLWDDQDHIDPEFDTGADGYGIQVLMQLAEHMPILAEQVGLARVTCGWYANTADHKAILGEDPRLAGFFHAAGFSGHGVMHAAATGLTLAELILGRQPSLATRQELAVHFGLPTLLEGNLREPVEDMVL